MTKQNTATTTKPDVVKDQAKVDSLHKDYDNAMDKGDDERASKDVAEAAEIMDRDPAVHS